MVHDEGYGCPDTGCGKGLIGAETLEKHRAKLQTLGEDITWLKDQATIQFKYGNGNIDNSIGVIRMPAWIGGQKILLQLWVVPGKVPLLISKRMMKTAGAYMDMCNDTMHLSKLNIKVPMETAKSGHYQINLLDVDGKSLEEKPGQVPVLTMCDDEIDQAFMEEATTGFR
jgi:hypothetical protein